MNETTRQLDILSFLAQRTGASVSQIIDHLEGLGYQASEPTIKRDIAVLRTMDADIISDRHVGYRLMNWDQIRKRVRRLRDLERERVGMLDDGLLA